MVNKIRTVLSGLGNINRSLLKILEMKEEQLKRSFGLEFTIVGVADSSGSAARPSGFDAGDLRAFKEQGGRIADLPEGTTDSIKDLVGKIEADLILEASPVDLETGHPGLQVTRAALSRGMHVVLANKAPLVLDYAGVHALARDSGVGLAFSATVCGSLPVINIGRRDLVVAEIESLRGILNSTSNFVLGEMEQDRNYDEAIVEAQKRGIAEADPSLDVEGWDTASKLVIIANAVLGVPTKLQDLTVEGITGVTSGDLSQARERGKTIKLLARARRSGDGYDLEVGPCEVDRDEFLGRCSSWQMGVEIQSDIYGRSYHKNSERAPLPTAAAMLRDAVNLLS